MVQEFHVVRCFSCQSFQVHQVKKVNRWSCKLCGEKQSLKKEFGRGSGADCRRHVQKLNAMRGAVMEKQEHNTWSLCKQEEEEEHEQETPGSRWTKYLDPPEEAEPEDEDEENVLMDRQHLHGNNTADRKRKRREETDGGRSSYSPEQSNWSRTTSAETTSSPSPSLNRPSLNWTSSILNQPSLNWPTLNRPSPILNRPSVNQPSPSLNQPSLNWTSSILNQPSLNWPTLNRPSPILNRPSVNQPSPSLNQPSLNRPSPPNMSSGPASRWSCFLSSSESQREGAEPLISGRSHREGAEPPVSGRSQAVGGAASLPCNDVISQAPPLPRPLLPVSSMFESGEDFSFDDF